MRVQNRIVLLAVVLAAAFTFLFLAYRFNERVKIKEISLSAITYRKNLFRNLLELKGASARMLAFDYTYWDELVNFVNSKDPAWARDNLETSLSVYHVDGIWVFRQDASWVYSVLKKELPEVKEYPVSPAELQGLMQQNTFAHFFVKTSRGPLEIFGAPIQPSQDTQRKTPALGYFLVGKFYDQEYLAELGRLIDGKVSVIGDTPNRPTEQTILEKGVFLFNQALSDGQGRTIGFIQVEMQSAALREVFHFSRRTMVLALWPFGLMLFIVFLALDIWVSRPLQFIVSGLERQDASGIRNLIVKHDEFGDVARLMGQFFEQQEVLKQSRERYRLIFETAASLILSVDRERKIVNCNRRSREVLGYEAEELIGQPLRKILHPKSYLIADRILEEIMEKGSSRHNEYQLVRKDNCQLDVSANSSAVRDSEGKFLHTITVIEDITERKRMEDALRWVNEKLSEEQIKLKIALANLESANEELIRTQAKYLQSEKMAAVGQLSAGVAHEIKNPLAVILLGIERIESKSAQLDDQARQFLRMIKDATLRANNVVLELLNFSRYTELKVESLDVTEVIRSALTLLKNSELDKKAVIETRIAPNIPLIEGDRILLEQVIFNLLTNALHATENKPDGKILISASCPDDPQNPLGHVLIKVEDNGCGMSEDIRIRIFDPFFTTKDQGKGTGLGLSTVFMIIEKHKGTIAVESEEGKGTNFIISLSVKLRGSAAEEDNG